MKIQIERSVFALQPCARAVAIAISVLAVHGVQAQSAAQKALPHQALLFLKARQIVFRLCEGLRRQSKYCLSQLCRCAY